MTVLPTPPQEYTHILARASVTKVDVDGLGVQLYRWGSGSNCFVLLHGGYGSWAHWIKVIPQLESHATVIAPDMPGFGLSDTPLNRTRPSQLLGRSPRHLSNSLARKKSYSRDFLLVVLSRGMLRP